ncbi:MAG: glycoside hydrolase family protein, partial [Armatimonadota bacterium]|nr:glycoside hydrolase family protein [Armatimonadota bacterium]
DFITIHWYGGNDPQGFLGYLANIHNMYHRPLWITEFAPADWSGHRGISPQQSADFMKVVVPEMNKRDYVERYAWFSAATGDAALGASALFHNDGSLTELGKVYAGL